MFKGLSRNQDTRICVLSQLTNGGVCRGAADIFTASPFWMMGFRGIPRIAFMITLIGLYPEAGYGTYNIPTVLRRGPDGYLADDESYSCTSLDSVLWVVAQTGCCIYGRSRPTQVQAPEKDIHVTTRHARDTGTMRIWRSDLIHGLSWSSNRTPCCLKLSSKHINKSGSHIPWVNKA